METRYFPELAKDKFNDENHRTVTSKEQESVEALIAKCFDRFEQLVSLDATLPIIYRTEHIRFIEAAIRRLSGSYECLDSSRPWMVYWILNAAQLLGHRMHDELLDHVVNFLCQCRAPDGGFGGGPGQYPHLAPTYAAVNSLCIIGTERALHAIDRKTMQRFLWSVREANGAFRLHVDGETDIRGVYCAVTVARLCHFAPADMATMFAGTVAWISSCQTYEGGIGGAPDLEAHGGYTFCGIAALALLESTGTCNLQKLLRWAVNRQMCYEGGFQGRTNKLVDGCYSFWQGAIMPIVQALIYTETKAANAAFYAANPCKPFVKDDEDADYKTHLKSPLFDRGALQEYILICCQRPTGGLVDKPGKPPDLYHTCYTLSGLAIAQHCENDMYPMVLGDADNELNATHPMYNIPAKSIYGVAQHFGRHNYDLYPDDNNSSIPSNGASPDFWATLDDTDTKAPSVSGGAGGPTSHTDTDASSSEMIEEESSTRSDRASSVATTTTEGSSFETTSASGTS